MKKMLSLALGVCLSGCAMNDTAPATKKRIVIRPISAGPISAGYSVYRDLAPTPWLRVIPSERSLAYKDVEFGFISERLRSSIAMNDQKCACKRFAGVTSVLVDYRLIPTEEMAELIDSEIAKLEAIADRRKGEKIHDTYKKPKPYSGPVKNYDGQAYAMDYEIKPTGYIITLSFYTNNQSPPCPPAFVGMAYTDELTIGTYEAFQFMIEELIEEHVKHPEQPKVVVNLQYY